MALTTICNAKELSPITYQPLILAEITFGTIFSVVSASNASPVVVVLNGPHGLANGNTVTVSGACGNTGANGTYAVTVVDAYTLSLTGSSGTGTYISSGVLSIGNVLRFASRALNAIAEGGGGVAYNGVDYLPRLQNQQQAIQQALSDQGVDFTPQVTLSIADPDNAIFGDWEYNGPGFKGAMMVLRFVFYDTVAGVFSTDATIRFTGLCQQASCDENLTTVTAVSKMNMVNTQMPTERVSVTCVWQFPGTAAQRQDGADNSDSQYFRCGYSPDATGANAVGNYQTGTTPYTDCNLTRADCMLRLGNSASTGVAPDGDIGHDTTGRPTGRFGGFTFSPLGTYVSRSYITGNWEQIINNSNQVKYGDLIPLAYGTGWVNALVLFTDGDANYTTIQVLVCSSSGAGPVPYVYHVICNGLDVPHTNNDAVMPYVPGQLQHGNLTGGWWGAVNNGGRNGSPNAGLKGDDPYGSMCVLTITVPAQAAASSSTPSVQVWLDGPPVRVYTAPNVFTFTFSDNPAWVMLNILLRAGWRIWEIDVPSFIAAAAIWGTAISQTGQTGTGASATTSYRAFGSANSGPIPYAMFAISLCVRQRTSAADLLRGLRNNCKALLVPNYNNGLLHLMGKGTLASQQPTPPMLNGQVATNDTTAYPSVNLDGSNGTGYTAYTYDERHILNVGGPGTPSTFRILPRTLSDSPNDITLAFEDMENQYATDSIEVVDTEDTSRVQGQSIIATIPILGINSFDRAQRAIATWMAENIRGNLRNNYRGEPLGDTGGTYKIEFEVSFRGIHHKIGDIIGVTYQQRGISKETFRITSLQPGVDASRIKIQAQWHNDGWYITTFGQQDAPLYRHPQGLSTTGPMSWCPGLVAPLPGDSMIAQTEKNFLVYNSYIPAADGTAIFTVVVQGTQPANAASMSPQPPLVSMQASSSATGGTIPGGRTYYIGISVKNVAGSDYLPSYLSAVKAAVTVSGATNTNTITVSVEFWDSTALGYVVFAGTSPSKMSYQKDVDFGAGAGPASITLTSYNEASWGAPDQNFDHIRTYTRFGVHLGVAGGQVLSCTSNTITIAVLDNAGFTINQFAGYDVSIMGMMASAGSDIPSSGPLPIWNAKIASNTATTLTLAAGLDGIVPDPTAVPRPDGVHFGLITDDVIVIRSLPTIGSDSIGNYVEDLNWINALNPLQDEISVVACSNANPGVITTATPHGYSNGDQIYIQSMSGMSGFPLLVTATVLTATTFSVGIDTTAFGTYSGGGTSAKQDQGLIPNAEVGNELWALTGTGRGQRVAIASNTQTRIYISGDWIGGVPDTTTRFIVVSAGDWYTESSGLPTASYMQLLSTNFNIENYAQKGMVVVAVSEDPNDNEALYFNSPMRDFFVMGSPGELTDNSSDTIQIAY